MHIRLGHLTVTGRQIAAVVTLLVIGILLAAFFRQLDMSAIHRRAEGINGVLVFAALTLLPLVGFPVSLMHATAGVRFGIGWGLGLVALSVLLQLITSHTLVHAAPKFFAKRLESIRQKLPHAAHRPLTIFTMLLPGAPYVAQIYVLPLVGVPLRTFVAYSFPIITARSTVGITFGDLSDDLTPARMAGFLAYAVALMLTCAWSFQRLRARLADQQTAAGDPTPPA